MNEPHTALTFPNIDPVIFSIGPLSVYWYGLGYIVGIFFAWWYGKRLLSISRFWAGNKSPIKAETFDDFVLWAALGIVIGGRIGYVLFYNFSYYLSNPLAILATWDGGMSFHGGMLGVILSIFFFTRLRSINVWNMFDIVAAGAPFGLGVVRIANFINSELWGRVTNVPWAFVFPNGGPLPRHPSQLYESALEGFILFFVLRVLTHGKLKLKTPGFVSGSFLVGYGICRISVEFFREPDRQLGYLFGDWLTMGMLLSLPMIGVGVWIILRAKNAAAQKHA